MAVGIARAALEELRKILTEAGVEISYDKPSHAQSAPAAEFLRMEADWEAAYLLTVRSAWQADNDIPNSKEASMGKAKAGARRHATSRSRPSKWQAPRAIPSKRYWRSGPATPRSSTSSRARSRSSSWWWPVGCSGCRHPS